MRVFPGRTLRMLMLAVLVMAAMTAFARSSHAQDAFAVPAAEAAPAVHATTLPAKEEPQGGLLDPDLGTAFFTVCIFVALLIILRFTAWKPILTGLKSRESAIRDSIEAVDRAKAQAAQTTRDLETKMAEVQRQAADQLNQAKADAVKIADAIRAQAETESAALKDRTLREIDAAKQQALGEINAHAATLGTAVARKILQRDVTLSDQQRLVDESLAELAKKN